MSETGFVTRRMKEYEKETTSPTKPDFTLIQTDLKLAWKFAVRALNAAESTGATDTACNIKDIVIGLSTTLEFCESMAGDSGGEE